MVAYSFKRRFVEPIRAGTKVQTIRAVREGRSRHARPGETLQLYVGMRTRHCRLIGKAVCLAVEAVRIVLPRAGQDAEVLVWTLVFGEAGELLHRARAPASLNTFAREDGFRDFDDLEAFWRTEHPGQDTFDGVLIRWQPLAAAVDARAT